MIKIFIQKGGAGVVPVLTLEKKEVIKLLNAYGVQLTEIQKEILAQSESAEGDVELLLSKEQIKNFSPSGDYSLDLLSGNNLASLTALLNTESSTPMEFIIKFSTDAAAKGVELVFNDESFRFKREAGKPPKTTYELRQFYLRCPQKTGERYAINFSSASRDAKDGVLEANIQIKVVDSINANYHLKFFQAKNSEDSYVLVERTNIGCDYAEEIIYPGNISFHPGYLAKIIKSFLDS